MTEYIYIIYKFVYRKEEGNCLCYCYLSQARHHHLVLVQTVQTPIYAVHLLSAQGLALQQRRYVGGFDLGIKHHHQQYYPIPHAFGFVLLSVFGFIFMLHDFYLYVLVLGV
jgi:hypothetical protein